VNVDATLETTAVETSLAADASDRLKRSTYSYGGYDGDYGGYDWKYLVPEYATPWWVGKVYLYHDDDYRYYSYKPPKYSYPEYSASYGSSGYSTGKTY
jgi:hypothetical protein